MSNLDPNAPSQPTLNTAYDQPGNPAESTTAEDRTKNSTLASKQRSDPTQETRQTNDVLSGGDKNQEHATPSSLAYGVHPSSSASSTMDNPNALGDTPASTLEGEQMRAPGEGDVASVQEKKRTGDASGFGEQGSLTAGMDRKKEQQQRGLAEQEGSREEGGGGGGVDVRKAMEGKESAFVGAGDVGDMRGEGQTQGMGGGLGMQTGHGQV